MGIVLMLSKMGWICHLQVGIASKYMGPIILSLNYMMKDVLLFLITFTVIMLAFASGVAYIFNMASGKDLQNLIITLDYFCHALLECETEKTINLAADKASFILSDICLTNCQLD